jgi:hypothetical protein
MKLDPPILNLLARRERRASRSAKRAYRAVLACCCAVWSCRGRGPPAGGDIDGLLLADASWVGTSRWAGCRVSAAAARLSAASARPGAVWPGVPRPAQPAAIPSRPGRGPRPAGRGSRPSRTGTPLSPAAYLCSPPDGGRARHPGVASLAVLAVARTCVVLRWLVTVRAFPAARVAPQASVPHRPRRPCGRFAGRDGALAARQPASRLA